MIKLLYFARLREELGISEETIALPESITSVGQLHTFLCGRSSHWAEVLQRPGLFIAVNQTVVDHDEPLTGNEEVAFFPPVTGG